MKNTIISLSVLFVVVLCNTTTAQQSLSTCKSLPMISGSIIEVPSEHSTAGKTDLRVVSGASEVYSLCNGTVSSVLSFTDDDKQKHYMVIVQDANDTFVTYTYLSEAKVSRNDKIQKNQLIGKASPSKEPGKSEVGLAVATVDSDKKRVTLNQYSAVLSFINRHDR